MSRRLIQLAGHFLCPSPTADGVPTEIPENIAAERSHPEEMVSYELSEEGIATITLNNHARRNPLSYTVLSRLKSLLGDIAAGGADGDNSVKVVLLKSTGNVWSSGHDFMDDLFPTAEEKQRHREGATLSMLAEVSMLFRQIPQTTISVVQGLATAGGCQLAVSCDMVIASEKATFRTPGAAGGAFCHVPGVAVADRIHPRKAFEVLMLAYPIPADEAKEMGLVNKVVPADKLDAEAQRWAKRLARASSSNIQAGKKAFYEQIAQPSLKESYEVAEPYMKQAFNGSNADEMMEAFFNKRHFKPTD